MSKKFVNALKKETNITYTENNATALKSTYFALVDLFAQIGSFRGRSESEIEHAFSKAFTEDKLLATKMAFYARNIRGGLGERRVFKVIMSFLAKIYPEVAIKNVEHIPTFGRYDDLYEFVGTKVEDAMWNVIKTQWISDIRNMRKSQPISLMAKWLGSVNTSSKRSIRLGKLTAKKLGLTETKYRKLCSQLRKYLNVVEVKMSNKDWENIQYSTVPSKAMSNYRNAFKKHDKDGFDKFISSVEKGEEKINASTLFPYDILEKMGLEYGYGWRKESNFKFSKYDKVLEEQWKALPNYVEGEQNILIMADTSGSMSGRPIHTSIGLAIYFAERNHGVFHNKFITFSSRPSFVELNGKTLYEKIKCVPAIVENTNLEKAFKLVLDTAIQNRLSQEDMPKSFCIISDCQFDSQTTDYRMTWHDAMVKMYNQHGYTMPNIIYWNVRSPRDTFQVTSDYKGVQLYSGQSPSVFKTIIRNLGRTPYEAMLDTLNNPIYDCITV